MKNLLLKSYTKGVINKVFEVIIDKKLNWKVHIKYVATKSSKYIAIVFRTQMLLDKNSLHTLYRSLFLPYINYCAEIRGNTFKTDFRPIILL